MYERLNGTEYVVTKQLNESAFAENDDGTLYKVTVIAVVNGYGDQLFLVTSPQGEQLHDYLIKDTAAARRLHKDGRVPIRCKLDKMMSECRRSRKHKRRSTRSSAKC